MEYVAKISEARVVQGIAKEAERSDMALWRSLVSSIEYAPAHELNQGLSHSMASFDAVLARPPSQLRIPSNSWTTSQAVLLLTPSPNYRGFRMPLSSWNWWRERELETELCGTLMGAASCLMQTFAQGTRGDGDGQVLEILRHSDYRHAYLMGPLPERTSWTSGFLVISGEYLNWLARKRLYSSADASLLLLQARAQHRVCQLWWTCSRSSA